MGRIMDKLRRAFLDEPTTLREMTEHKLEGEKKDVEKK